MSNKLDAKLQELLSIRRKCIMLVTAFIIIFGGNMLVFIYTMYNAYMGVDIMNYSIGSSLIMMATVIYLDKHSRALIHKGKVLMAECNKLKMKAKGL